MRLTYFDSITSFKVLKEFGATVTGTLKEIKTDKKPTLLLENK